MRVYGFVAEIMNELISLRLTENQSHTAEGSKAALIAKVRPSHQFQENQFTRCRTWIGNLHRSMVGHRGVLGMINGDDQDVWMSG